MGSFSRRLPSLSASCNLYYIPSVSVDSYLPSVPLYFFSHCQVVISVLGVSVVFISCFTLIVLYSPCLDGFHLFLVTQVFPLLSLDLNVFEL